MDDFFKTLWTSYIAEASSAMVDLDFIFKKPHLDLVDIQVVLRLFHNMKSNSRLFEYTQISDSSALGEEICREILNNRVAANDEAEECLRAVYRHACYLFDCVKTDKTEPASVSPWSGKEKAPGLDVDAIRLFLYGGTMADHCTNYVQRELEAFSTILAQHFTFSLAANEHMDRSVVQNSIITIKAAAELLELKVLAKLYDELYHLWCEKRPIADTVWQTATHDIVAEVKRIEKDSHFNFSLQQVTQP